VLISYLCEDKDAEDTARLVEQAGRKAVLFPGDISSAEHCRALVAKAVEEFGRIDILVNNAAHQDTFSDISEISDEEWEHTFATNIHAMFYITKAAVPHMPEGSSIINTTSIQADNPSEELLAYATTKGAIQNFTGGLAQLLAEKGIRAKLGCPGTDMDSAHPRDDAVRKGSAVREAGADEAAGPAQGARSRLRHAGER
jgi:NAD(P)-dependent dehydrogenase (short-subunit alcohol dehydrogenase family)